MSEVPVDLYIAAYSDPSAAQQDWDDIKQLARDDVITVDGLVLVSRDADGKIDVKDNANDVGRGAAIGAVGGAVIGLIFPPAFLASALVGGGIGAAPEQCDRREKKEIKADVEDVLSPNSSGIVALFEERWVGDVDKALSHADNVASTRSTWKAPRTSRQPRPTDRRHRRTSGPTGPNPTRTRLGRARPRTRIAAGGRPSARLRRSRSCRPGWRTRRSRRCTTSRPN